MMLLLRRWAAPWALLASLTIPMHATAKGGPRKPKEAAEVPSLIVEAPRADRELPPAVVARDPREDECPHAVDLVPGRPMPVGLVGADGIVLCRATVVPTSELAYLLDRDTWADQVLPRFRLLDLDLERAELVSRWERERANRLQALLDKPTPFLHRPGTQRLIGAVEALAVTVVVGAILANTGALRFD